MGKRDGNVEFQNSIIFDELMYSNLLNTIIYSPEIFINLMNKLDNYSSAISNVIKSMEKNKIFDNAKYNQLKLESVASSLLKIENAALYMIEATSSTVDAIIKNDAFSKMSILSEQLSNIYNSANFMQKIDSVASALYNMEQISSSISQVALNVDLYSRIELVINNTMKEYSSILKNIELEGDSSHLDLYDYRQYDENRKELSDDIHEIFTEENWQQSFAKYFDKWKNKNPIISFVLCLVVTNILSSFCNTIFVGVATKIGMLKDTPEKNGVVIEQININQEVTIINSCPYYYEILVMDLEKIELHGWIAKKNINIIELD